MDADQTDERIQFMKPFAIGQHFQSHEGQERQDQVDHDSQKCINPLHEFARFPGLTSGTQGTRPRLERGLEQKVPVQAMPRGSSFSLLAWQDERCSSSSLRE